jgi:hypothetical protein
VFIIGILGFQFLLLIAPARALQYPAGCTHVGPADGNQVSCSLSWTGSEILNDWDIVPSSGCTGFYQSTGPDAGGINSTPDYCISGSTSFLKLRYTFPVNFQDIFFGEIHTTGYQYVLVRDGNGITYPTSGVPVFPGNFTSMFYTPGGGHLDLEYSGSDAHQIVRSISLGFSANALPPAAIIPSGGVDGTCKACSYTPTGDWVVDAPNLIDYLACQIGNIFYCHIIPILLGIWRQIVEFMTLIQSVIFYAINSMNRIALWVNGNITTVVRYTAGTIDNGVTRIENAIYTSGSTTVIQSGNASLLDVILEFIRQVGNLLNNFVNTIPGIINAFRDIVVSIVGGIVQIAFLLVQLVITLINVVIMLLGVALRVLSIIPLLLSAFGDGFSGAIANPMAPAVGAGTPIDSATILGQSCQDEVYFQMCLGVYVLDNTIFLDDTGSDFSFPGFIAFMKMLVGTIVLIVIARRIRYAFARA